MSDFELKHPGNLAKAPAKFADCSADLTAALSQLQSVLAGCTAMCGDDEQGREFAKGYDPAAKTVAESLKFASTGVAAVGDAVRAMSDNYKELEDKGVHATRTNGAG